MGGIAAKEGNRHLELGLVLPSDRELVRATRRALVRHRNLSRALKASQRAQRVKPTSAASLHGDCARISVLAECEGVRVLLGTHSAGGLFSTRHGTGWRGCVACGMVKLPRSTRVLPSLEMPYLQKLRAVLTPTELRAVLSRPRPPDHHSTCQPRLSQGRLIAALPQAISEQQRDRLTD